MANESVDKSQLLNASAVNIGKVQEKDPVAIAKLAEADKIRSEYEAQVLT